ncbi:pyridoxamine 5'-phosphate oxidase [Aeromicrobium sp. PE09-221]|uniref:pyridoxamine 5'-phosphate oxidase n=1 Tax=Aeromicrobium sp. PE09-221 TaxID=1898043 RepID=UPI000B3E8800|nr:pyridoxamine 5'-phosphate oxidase [Aeromicrobium sp. PE09-221]OUZ07831.1 pyridoxamine 5'-phosphate oxidase [Aeromicrobium sp. PE09-221]
MDSADFTALRHEYEAAGLSEQDAGDDPIALFERWLEDAIGAGLDEPNAMVVATATPDGSPSVRTVLLKQLDERGLVFFTSYASRKGREIAANPRAAVVMPWHPLQRQIRVEGPVERVDPADSDAYFATRPLGSRIAAIASPQSEPVSGRDELDRRYAQVERSGGEIERPESWGGYRIGWETVEFWQGRRNRFHDRLRFRREGGRWTRDRLAP